MTDLRSCTKVGLGFAVVAGLSATAALAEGGEDPGSPVIIPSVPYADTGDTSDNLDDWDEVCPFTGSTSPDVFYSYTPAADEAINISLCESAYDTKVYVLDAGFVQVACNDDACNSSGGGQFRSLLENVALTGGAQYYIVVDGYTGDAGVYDLVIDLFVPPPPCELDCVLNEGEPCDDTGAPDIVNGGCNSTPAVFSVVNCGDTICGEAWAAGGTRDTDWYEVTLTEAGEVTMTVTAEAELFIFTISGVANGVCNAAAVDSSFLLTPCEEGSVSYTANPGEAYTWVGHSEFDLLPCGQENPGNTYQATWSCGDPVAPPCPALGDINEDAEVGFADLLIVLDNWGPCPL